MYVRLRADSGIESSAPPSRPEETKIARGLRGAAISFHTADKSGADRARARRRRPFPRRPPSPARRKRLPPPAGAPCAGAADLFPGDAAQASSNPVANARPSGVSRRSWTTGASAESPGSGTKVTSGGLSFPVQPLREVEGVPVRSRDHGKLRDREEAGDALLLAELVDRSPFSGRHTAQEPEDRLRSLQGVELASPGVRGSPELPAGELQPARADVARMRGIATGRSPSAAGRRGTALRSSR